MRGSPFVTVELLHCHVSMGTAIVTDLHPTQHSAQNTQVLWLCLFHRLGMNKLESTKCLTQQQDSVWEALLSLILLVNNSGECLDSIRSNAPRLGLNVRAGARFADASPSAAAALSHLPKPSRLRRPSRRRVVGTMCARPAR